MHRDTLASGNEADDVVSGHRRTALGELDPDLIRTQTGDGDRRIARGFGARLLRTRGHGLGQRLLRAVSPTQVVDQLGDDVLCGDVALADSCVQAGHVRIAERRRDRQDRLVAHEALERQVLLAHRAGKRLLAGLHSFLAAFLGEPRLDLGARTRRCDKGQPVARRSGLIRFRGHDLDRLARLEACIQGDEAAVDLRAHRAVADLRVHRIREVDGRRTRRQYDDLTLRRKHVDLIAGDLVAQRIEEFLRIPRLALHLDQSAQPVRLLVRAHAIRIATRSVRVLLVLPVRGDAVLGALMHVEGTDLDLHRLATGSDDRRMQRLVEIKLRHRNVVFETAGNRVPAPVQRPQHAVAILDRLHQDTHSHQIEDLIEGLAAHDHLLVDRVVALRTATHRPLRARTTQILFDLVDDISQVFFALGRPLRDEAVDLLVDLRVQRLERQLFELPLHHVHAEAMSQRRVDL